MSMMKKQFPISAELEARYQQILLLTLLGRDDKRRMYLPNDVLRFIISTFLGSGAFLEYSVFKGHTSWVCCMLVHQDRVFTGCGDGTISVWDGLKRNRLAIMEGHTRGVNCMAVYNGHLYSGSDDCCINIYKIDDIDTAPATEYVNTANPVNEHVGTLARQRKSGLLGSLYKKVRHVVKSVSNLLPSLPRFQSLPLNRLPKKYSLVGSLNSSVEGMRRGFTAHINWVSTLDIDHEQKVLYSGSGDGRVKMWDLTSGKTKGNLFMYSSSDVQSIAMIPGLLCLPLISRRDGSVRSWSSEDSTPYDLPVLDIVLPRQGKDYVSSIYSLPGDDRVFFGTRNGIIRVCKKSVINSECAVRTRTTEPDQAGGRAPMPSVSILAELIGHTNIVSSMVAYNDRLYSACWDGTIGVWDLKTYERCGTVQGHVGAVRGVLVHHNKLFSCGNDNNVHISTLPKRANTRRH